MNNLLHNFLNKKNSTRSLSDEEFERVLPQLAKELSQVNFLPIYSESDLHKDWKSLKDWHTTERTINSTSRKGMKLCEHFFPNFYQIEMKGKNFQELWNKDNLMKILRWNRNSHSTPYLSEIKRGIYFCCGLTKNTQYRPQMAKMITEFTNAKRVLDPCAGWGGRMLGVVAAGSEYVGYEPNTETYKHLQELVNFLNIEPFVTLYNEPAENMGDIGFFDLVITSPPYFNLEVYSKESTQSYSSCKNYKEWDEKWLTPLIKNCLSKLRENGVSAWNVADVANMPMWQSVESVHNNSNFIFQEVITIASSRRQSNSSKPGKNLDQTKLFKRRT